MRSPGVSGVGCRHCRASATKSRPAASKAMAMTLRTSGSRAKKLAWNPSTTCGSAPRSRSPVKSWAHVFRDWKGSRHRTVQSPTTA